MNNSTDIGLQLGSAAAYIFSIMKSLHLVSLLVALLTLHGVPATAADPSTAQKEKTPIKLACDPAHTALLIMDYQNDILGYLPENAQAPLLDKASALLKEARQAQLLVIYVVVRFREGYPEVNPDNPLFSNLKTTGRLREGTPGAEIHSRVAPQPGEVVITKRRVGAFSTTDLETVLRAHNINTLAMCGIATSGVVLSTVRWAADMDYRLVVIADACADRDAEVHRVLMEKVFSRQASVVTTADFLKELRPKHAAVP